MNWIDYVIVVGYFVIMLSIGVVHQRKAAQDSRAYFLGGNKLPWWITAMSLSMASIDITGIMVNVSIFYYMGIKSFYYSIWVISGIALMAHLGRWIRRSNVITAAEWMTTRFGQGTPGELPRLTIAIVSVGTLIGMVAYGFVGVGKFIAEFLPALSVNPSTNIAIYGIIVIGITTIYSMLGGLFSVAYTDLVQTFILLAVTLYVSILAFVTVGPEFISANTPSGWDGLSIRPTIDYLKDVTLAGYDRGAFYNILPWLMMWLTQTFLAFFSGPSGGPGMQFMLSTKSARETCKQAAGMQILAFPRWTLIAGLALLAMAFNGQVQDTDTIVPVLINMVLPVGLKGMVLVGFLAAFMSTFSISINNGCSYIMNDIYLRHIRPHADRREFVLVTYMVSFLVVIVGVILGIGMQSILELGIWIFSIMFGSMIVPMVIRWYWWRFNGWGFSAGVGAAFLIAIAQKILQKGGFVDWPDYVFYFIMLSASFLVSMLVTLLTPATDEKVLIKFYTSIQPWGFWKPVRSKVLAEMPNFKSEKMVVSDFVNMVVGAISIFALNVLPFYLMLHNWNRVCILGGIFLVTSVVLYFTWYKTLPKDKGSTDKFHEYQAEAVPDLMV